MSTASLSVVAVVGLVQGFVQWPLIVSCVRWLIRWFEEANTKRKPPGWIYFTAFLFGLLLAEVIEGTAAMVFIRTTGSDAEAWRQAGRCWVGTHLFGIFVQMILLGIVSRLRK